MNDYIISIYTTHHNDSLYLTVSAKHKVLKNKEFVLVSDLKVNKRLSKRKLINSITTALEKIYNGI